MSSQQPTEPYAFGESLPLNGIDPGTTLFVAGDAWSGAEDLALAMVLAAADYDERMVFISTRMSGEKILDQCAALSSDLDRSRIGIVDCGGQGDADPANDARVETVSSAGDLTGIGIKFSSLYGSLYGEAQNRVRAGFFTVSTLLMYTDLRTAYRFLHTVSGRVTGTDGLCLFLVDPSTHDEQTVSTLAQLCDGRIDTRKTDDGRRQLRVRGLPDQPEGWQSFDVSGGDR